MLGIALMGIIIMARIQKPGVHSDLKVSTTSNYRVSDFHGTGVLSCTNLRTVSIFYTKDVGTGVRCRRY